MSCVPAAARLTRHCPYMYPKPLCIQSKMAESWHAGAFQPGISQCRDRWPEAPISWPPEAFIPRGTAYLGQTFGEPRRRCNVLSPTGDSSDETSIRRGRVRRPLPVIILRFRQPRPGSGGSLSDGPQRDRAPRRAADAGGSADPVDAGRQPGEMAPRPHHLVLRAIPARRALPRLPAVPSRLRLPVQFLLCQRRPPACPPPARPSDPPRRRRSHRLPPARRRGRGEVLSRGRRGRADRRSRRWSKSASTTSSSIRN